jgi:hypothetical protein
MPPLATTNIATGTPTDSVADSKHSSPPPDAAHADDSCPQPPLVGGLDSDVQAGRECRRRARRSLRLRSLRLGWCSAFGVSARPNSASRSRAACSRAARAPLAVWGASPVEADKGPERPVPTYGARFGAQPMLERQASGGSAASAAPLLAPLRPLPPRAMNHTPSRAGELTCGPLRTVRPASQVGGG